MDQIHGEKWNSVCVCGYGKEMRRPRDIRCILDYTRSWIHLSHFGQREKGQMCFEFNSLSHTASVADTPVLFYFVLFFHVCNLI